VADVRELDNYFACSLSTRSEIVVLVREGDRIVGQFEVDSDEEAVLPAKTKPCSTSWSSSLHPAAPRSSMLFNPTEAHLFALCSQAAVADDVEQVDSNAEAAKRSQVRGSVSPSDRDRRGAMPSRPRRAVS
jgi:hypothetical protein